MCYCVRVCVCAFWAFGYRFTCACKLAYTHKHTRTRTHSHAHTHTHTHTHTHVHMHTHTHTLRSSQSTKQQIHKMVVSISGIFLGVHFEWKLSHTYKMARCSLFDKLSHLNKSRHILKSHVTHEWVMLHVSESCHTWMNHVTDIWSVEMYSLSGNCLTPVKYEVATISRLLQIIGLFCKRAL